VQVADVLSVAGAVNTIRDWPCSLVVLLTRNMRVPHCSHLVPLHHSAYPSRQEASAPPV